MSFSETSPGVTQNVAYVASRLGCRLMLAPPLFTRPQVATFVDSYLASANAKTSAGLLASPLRAQLAGMPLVRIHVR